MNESLPHEVVVAWGAMLVVGSLCSLVGLYWRGSSATGLLLERAGLVGVGGASIVYSSVALSQNGLNALFSACITVGFGAACFAQARRISRRITAVLEQMAAQRGQR